MCLDFNTSNKVLKCFIQVSLNKKGTDFLIKNRFKGMGSGGRGFFVWRALIRTSLRPTHFSTRQGTDKKQQKQQGDGKNSL